MVYSLKSPKIQDVSQKAGTVINLNLDSFKATNEK